MNKYVCTICGFIFDEADGTMWDALPGDWACPLCGASKDAFELKDGVLNITADEHYRTNIVSPSIFEEYRKVINTAADFNKIILILEPK